VRHASAISARGIIVLVLMFSFDVTLYNGRESEIMAGFNFPRSLRVLWTPASPFVTKQDKIYSQPEDDLTAVKMN
jgi:hypothetical protein